LTINFLFIPRRLTDQLERLDRFVFGVNNEGDMSSAFSHPFRLESRGSDERKDGSGIVDPGTASCEPREIGRCLGALRIGKRREWKMIKSSVDVWRVLIREFNTD
jgi:hypothetical protein